ncbi:complex I subunit 5 family protein [Sporosalibacterium faouarense]|uniref:complex I subunit 5 family protein n=1 Tax=Sporosalibacterium faouarense TaxID=516123 RepID=UPI00141C9796|nr:proton-conducting transporter membrane subunit [Sporosalibacterium faouarense]MTI48468.1 hypothetical protein [Bacillota bacterium]
MNLIPIYIIFIPIITAMFVYVVNKKVFNYLVFLAQGVITFLSIRYYMLCDGFIEKQILVLGGWEKTISISLRNDRLSISFIFLTILMWWLILVYCWEKRKSDFKFLFFLLFLEGAFLGLIQTNDMFNMFIFIEITTILSTILIIYKKDGYSVRAGLYYLLFNSIGMVFFLLGLIFIYTVTGSLNLDIISEKISLMGENSVVNLSYILIIAAVGVKSAFFPVYNWLPKAHGAAPASISALLSGLLVKGGVYAFIRFNQVFNIDSLKEIFFIIGCITAISGVLFALSQKDIKQILAFHTISQIGIILMGLSSMTGKSYVGGVMHIFNHAIFKSLLFMGAGYIINVYGTRKITEIRGVFKNMPFISCLMIIGMLSITGAPLFNGLVSKTIIKYGLKDNGIKTIILYIINLGTGTSFIKMSQMFFGSFKVQKIKSYNTGIAMVTLAIICIILGNFYLPFTNILFGDDFSTVKVVSISSLLNYIISIGLGYLIYKWIIEKDYKIIKRLRHLNISFETTNFMLISFIFIMIIWSYF